MKNRVGLLSVLALVSVLPARPAPAQTVTNVRATQLADKTVEVLYDLSGAAPGGATITVVFNHPGDGCQGYRDVVPSPATVSGNAGLGVANGLGRRILWNAAASLPPVRCDYIAAVTATNPSSGGQEVTYTLPGGVPLVMVKIPAGTFQMGSPATEKGRDTDETLHQVALTSDYYIGIHEVTQGQWQAVMGTAPSYFPSCLGQCPVERVSWDDIRGASGFIAKLNELLGTTKFRLPTEAEWERAARGGTQSRFSFGNALDGDDECGANAEANEFVWWCGNSSSRTHGVGTKGSNPYGLFDMHGNVLEWVEDWYGDYPTSAQTNPTGPSAGSYRVVRGGAWYNSLRISRSALRARDYSGARFGDLGFRLAKSQ